MRCPSLNIFGTFFPAWMLCTLIGIVVAVAAHLLFARLRVEAELKPALLLYPSIALAVTSFLWLSFYGH
jgi:YtcA family